MAPDDPTAFAFAPLRRASSGTDRVQKQQASLAHSGGGGGVSSSSVGGGSSSFSFSAANPRSCVTCRKRKVKCDKNQPCGNCVRGRSECVFPSPARAPRKPRKSQDNGLMERLRRLEGVVQSLGMHIEDETGVNAIPPPPPKAARTISSPKAVSVAPPVEVPVEVPKKPTASSLDHAMEGLEKRFGRLVTDEGRSRYINSSFWASLNREVEDLKGILNAPSDDEEDYASPCTTSSGNSGHQGFMFGYSSQNVDMYSLHPPPEHIPKYWALFKENVDPLVKILHVPSTEPKVLQAKDHLDSLSKGFECLLFVIYYGVITSVAAHECLEFFGESRDALLKRYRFGLEQALARAHFLDSDEIVVLQAFTMFLILLRRNDDARIIWTLTGLVVRIAQALGIHRDGSHFGLPPFEIEMRRRLWWQVCILDARSSEDHGSDPTIVESSFDTQMPLNLNDSDLHPDMTELPESKVGFTDMTFCLVRFEVANMYRKILYVPPGPKCNKYFSELTIEDKEEWISECHQRLEEKYLQHCDMTVPLFWVAATIARLIMSKMWLVVYHPMQRIDGGVGLPQSTRDKLFLTSLENVEYAILLETEARTMRWGWLFKTYVPWHAMAFLLSELCVRTHGELVDRAWRAIEATIASRWGRSANESKRQFLWKPLRKLMLKARAARQAELCRERALAQPQPQPHPHPSSSFSSPTNTLLPTPTLSFAEAFPTFEAYVRTTATPSVMTPSATDGTTLPSTASVATPQQRLHHHHNLQHPHPHRPADSPSAETPRSNNRAGQEFLEISEHGVDWLFGDMMRSGSPLPDDGKPAEQLQPPQPGLSPTAAAPQSHQDNAIGGVPAAAAAGLADDHSNNSMDWASWDDLVRQYGMDADADADMDADVDGDVDVDAKPMTLGHQQQAGAAVWFTASAAAGGLAPWY